MLFGGGGGGTGQVYAVCGSSARLAFSDGATKLVSLIIGSQLSPKAMTERITTTGIIEFTALNSYNCL